MRFLGIGWGKMTVSRIFKTAAMVGTAALMMSQNANAQSVEHDIVNGVIQNIVQSVRDQIYRRNVAPPPGMMRFSGEASGLLGNDLFAARGIADPFDALAYAKADRFAPVPSSSWLYGGNLVGNIDRATVGTANIHVGVETVTGAFDITKIGVFSATDALTFIGTGTHAWSQAKIAPLGVIDTSMPAASATVSYLNGGFSADFSVLSAWSRNSASGFPAPANSTSLSYTGNVQYRFDLPAGTWFEPTVGVTYAEAYTANFNARTGDTTEVHGGLRFGGEMKWLGYTVQPTFSGVAFTIVDSNGGASAVGVHGARGSAKMNVLWTPKFSSYLEVHATASSGSTINIIGTQTAGVQAGLRYAWN